MKKDIRFIEWYNENISDVINKFVAQENTHFEPFIGILNFAFSTDEFSTLLKKYLLEESAKILENINKTSVLVDSPFSRYILNTYSQNFKISTDIAWIPRKRYFANVLKSLFFIFYVFYAGIKTGITLIPTLKKYKVMREALWGLKQRGYYFHDDFIIDEKMFHKNDLLLYSRGIPMSGSRKDAYLDAVSSDYKHFVLGKLPIGLNVLFTRIIFKYCIVGGFSLFKSSSNPNFNTMFALFKTFVRSAINYEKIFSNFLPEAELGHNYFSSSHICERIVCQNYKVRYYLAGWSDVSGKNDSALFAFLSCNKLLLWGKAYVQNVEGPSAPIDTIGCFLKKFIQQARIGRENIRKQMGVNPTANVITFFDQAFNPEVKANETHFINFWETILKVAHSQKDIAIIVKPKGEHFFSNLSKESQAHLENLKTKLTALKNVKIFNPSDWSFIEAIGISDIVVTQGMNTSSTLANISGIIGLYLNDVGDKHKFCEYFKGKLVFDNAQDLIDAIDDNLIQAQSPSQVISEGLMREFDAFADNNAIDRMRCILSGSGVIKNIKKKVGIIIQARMGSTRLPGKVMMRIKEKSILSILIGRLKKVGSSDAIIIATTTNTNDDVIAITAIELNVRVYRGDESDVLRRYYKAAKENSLDIVVRVTSDCPLADPELINNMIERFLVYDKIDYLSNTLTRTFPRGFDAEVFSFNALERAFKNADKPYEREHVTPYIYEHMNCINYSAEQDYSNYRVTVDTPEDFRLVCRIFDELNNLSFIYNRDVIDLLNNKPELAAINQDIQQKVLK